MLTHRYIEVGAACAYRGEAEEGEINGQHLDCQTDANRDWPWGIRRDHARSADTGRLSGCVQELNCLSTTHKEK
jgi:hypothetical protein